MSDLTPSARLAGLGLTLPPVTAPQAAYIPAVVAGGLVYVSGQLPFVDGKLLVTGKVGAAVDQAEAARLARICALNALGVAASVAGPDGLDGIARIVKVLGFVASAPGFNSQHLVINGASELLQEVFGEQGKHARSAVGMAELPLDTPVEVELIAELRR